jgi:3-hydroxyisobutyrate dehydrogenase
MNVGFCGLGNMGRPMAAALIQAGHDVTVWNRTPGPEEELRGLGAAVASTPSALAAGAEVVMTMLSDAAALEEVLFGPDGVAEGIRPGAAVIDMSTVGPAAIRSVAARLPAGVDLLDAPVKGGPGRAEKRKLKILVGGSEDAFARWSPLLEAMGAPMHVGPSGAGAAAKVLNNFAVISLTATLGETMALADALGIDEDLALDVLAGTPLAATAERQWTRATGESPPSFRLRLAAKDLGLAVDAAHLAGRAVPQGEAALEWLSQADAAGLGDEDQAAVVNLIRRSRRPRSPG